MDAMTELPRRDPESGLPFAEVTRRIEWSDTDASGHHHNSVVWRFVESCEAQLFRELGYLESYFNGAPRVHQTVDYENKLYFGQNTTTKVGLTKVGNSSLSFWFELWGEEQGDRPRRRAASGRFVTVHVAQGTETAIPWPDDLRQALLGTATSD
ncbi:acyl-CoA thioester hydrolase [Tessaracoccus flavus]|nr:acyl-CoA thioester hydrolase [Tessaracoccus flavus]